MEAKSIMAVILVVFIIGGLMFLKIRKSKD